MAAASLLERTALENEIEEQGPFAEREADLLAQIDELKEEILLRDRLFSIIGHELRAPVFQMNGMLYMLREAVERGGDLAGLEKFLADMDVRMAHVSTMLENLLRWAAGAQHGITLKKERVAVCALFEAVRSAYSEDYAKKGVALNVRVAADIEVETDREAMGIILSNLIGNALKYSPTGSQVQLEAQSLADGGVVLRVKDRGRGMTQRQLMDILGKGGTASTRGTDGERGTGIGLRLVRQLVRELGAKLSIDSREGFGTEIQVRMAASGGME